VICEKHKENPIKIYDQCVGCEIEYLRNQVKVLKERIAQSAIEPTESTQAEERRIPC
jgi:hypothetical protein